MLQAYMKEFGKDYEAMRGRERRGQREIMECADAECVAWAWACEGRGCRLNAVSVTKLRVSSVPGVDNSYKPTTAAAPTMTTALATTRRGSWPRRTAK